MLPVSAGSLCHLVHLQFAPDPRTAPTNPYGEIDHAPSAWVDGGRLWARIEPATGEERLYGGTQTPIATHKITVRGGANPDQPIPPSARLRWGARVFEIVAVLDQLERRTLTQLLTREISADG